MKWLFALLLTCSTLTAQVAGVALYLQYAPPGAPPPAPLAPPVPVTNFVPNSSFELGATRGWIIYGSGGHVSFGNETSIAGRVVTNSAYHGSNSITWRTRIISRPIFLTNGTYTLTFSMIADAPMTARWTNTSHDLRIDALIPVTVGTSWTRFTNQWVATSNGYYALKFYNQTDEGRTCMLDAVQLEPGAIASAYKPSLPVETGLATTDLNDALLAGDTKQFQVKFWNNTGTNTAASVDYTIYDMWNSNVASGTVTTNGLVPGPTTVNVSLPTGRTGWMRIMSYQPTVNDSWDERTVSVFPYAASTTVNTNGVLGSHPEWGPYAIARDRRLGYTASRDLSPAQSVRWPSVQPTAFGPFVWTGVGIFHADYDASTFSTNGTMRIVVLTPTDGNDPYWPPWAVNGSGAADINAWSNYCWQVANRYFPAPTNAWCFECGNEYHNIHTPTEFEGSSDPASLSYSLSASNRARFMVACAQAVSNATAGAATVVGLAGENIASRGLATWNWMTAGEKALFHVLSAHLYPQNSSTESPNVDFEDDIGSSQSSLAWKALFGTIRPLWNTEMGGAGVKGGFLGPVSLAPWSYITYGFLSPEAGRDWGMGQRKVVSVDRESRQVIRCLGNGFKKVINYTSRFFDDVNLNPSEGFLAGNMEITGAPKVATVATLIAANHFIRNPGLGRLTNSAVPGFIEAYFFTNQLGTVASLWTTDYLERSLTATDGRFGVYDCMGNIVQTNLTTFRIGRTPTFIVSGSLTTAQLSNTVVAASVVLVADTLGPSISIDVSPIGLISIGTTNFFKWTAVDRNKQAWSIGDAIADGDNTNLLYDVKFSAADPWIYIGQSNHFRKAFSAISTNRLYVRAKDHYNNFSTNFGPDLISY